MREIKILLIEDSDNDVKIFTDFVKEFSDALKVLKVDVAQKLMSSYDILMDNNYDLLVLDLNLPDSDGVESPKVLDTLEIDIPVIVVSGYSKLKTSVLPDCVKGFLCKGEYGAEHLQQTIESALSSS